MKCQKCGSDQDEGTRFCGSCGAQIEGSVLPRAATPRPLGRTVFQGSGSSGAKVAPIQVQPVRPSAAPSSPATAAPVPAAVVAPPAAAVAPVAAPVAEAHGGGHVAESPLDWVGRTLNNRYTVKNRLGEGGFGTVYRGEQIQMGRPCALKLLNPKVAKDPQIVGRFRREATAASALKSPHTVQIYDFDQTPEGVLYLAMELLSGRSLHVEMAHGPMPWARVLHVLDGIAESLGEAHGHGIVHRDIKPENVFLETLGSDHDFAKVLDFGIAKLVGGEGQGGQRMPALTAAGQTLGTLEYMSPEQLMGLQLDGRSDLYAVGILAYEMLTGDLPFQVKTAGEMISAHLKTTPPPPSNVVPESSMPPEVDALVLKLVEKDKNKRFKDAADLQQEIRRLLALLAPPAAAAGLPATAPSGPPAITAPASVTVLTRPPQAAKSGLLIVAVVAVLLIALIGGYFLIGKAGAAAPPPQASRLIPATMSALLSIDLAALRSQSPPAAMAALDGAIRPRLAELGTDPGKLGRLVIGVDARQSDRPTTLLVVDAVVDQKKLEGVVRKQLKKGEKLLPATYKGQKYRKSPSVEYAHLPGNRLLVSAGTGLGEAIDLANGNGAALVDGEAANLLRRVDAEGGKGPALIGWLGVNDDLRRQAARAAPVSAITQVALSLSLDADGAKLKAVADCGSGDEAKKAATSLQGALEQAKRDRNVAMLGLAALPGAVRVETDGGLLTASLSLSKEQYADLFTRLAGIAAVMAEQLPSPSAATPEPGKKAKGAADKSAPKAR